LPYINKAIKLSPANPEYWFILGDVQIKLAQYDEGIASYRKVIELDPDDTDIWLDLSVVYADRKDFEKGYAILVEGLRFHETHADFYFGMSYYLYMMGKSRQAGETMVTALGMDKEGHKRLFTTFPEAMNHPEILEIIQSFGK
jgi:tetratricopeptide (TPR) repeat protein